MSDTVGQKTAETKGYAVYDTTLGQFVSGVTADKPSDSDARKAVRKGHKFEVRAV